MDGKTQRAVVTAAVVGLLSAIGAGMASAEHEQDAMKADAAKAGKVPCYGINKCKGTGACGGQGRSCAGTNACKGQGYLELDKDTCLKIEGGRLTPEAAS